MNEIYLLYNISVVTEVSEFFRREWLRTTGTSDEADQSLLRFIRDDYPGATITIERRQQLSKVDYEKVVYILGDGTRLASFEIEE